MTTLVVVAVPRHVEVVAVGQERAETRRDLFERLATAFLRGTRYAHGVTSRATLALVLGQALDGESITAKVGRGDGAWEHVVDAIDDAIGTLRPLGVDARTLATIEGAEPLARVLRKAIEALDARLGRAGLVDERRRRMDLGQALARAEPDAVMRVVGASTLRAQGLLRWEADAVWWKPLAVAIRRAGGRVSVEIPMVSKRIDPMRERDPFEAASENVARALDEAPVEVELQPVFGDLTMTTAVPMEVRDRVAVVRALDSEAQARAVSAEVARALADGVPVDRVAVALPRAAGAAVTSTLTRHFDEAGIPLHVGVGEEIAGGLTNVVQALLTLGSRGLPRHDVAELLRSRALDARAVSGISAWREARAAVSDLADALDRTPSATEGGPLERLVSTARVRESPTREQRRALALRFGLALLEGEHAGTRRGRTHAARALFAKVGLHVGAGADVRAVLARDERRSTLVAHELAAYARDTRILEAVSGALDDIDRATALLDDDTTCSADTFLHELVRALRMRRPSLAARAGAVRCERIDELAFGDLDVVVVVDANAGVLPSRTPHGPLLTPTLIDALGRRDIHLPRAETEIVELATVRARRIVFSYRVSDDDAAVLAPSPVAAWLERGGVPAITAHAMPLMGAPTTPHERTLALIAVAPDRAAQLAHHAARVAVHEAAREAFHSGQGDCGTTIRDAVELRSLLEIESGGGARALSVTAVERLARCAFQGFAAQVLGALDDDPRLGDVPDRREEGILVHEALAAAFTAAAPLLRVRPRDRSAIERAAGAASEAALARDGVALVRAALDRIRLEVDNVVAMAIDDDDWDFACAEQSFGDADGWPAFVAADADVRVALRGRIDRVDVTHDASAVCAIDYKRRVSLPPIADLGGAAIQVPIYALVAKYMLGAAKARGRYLSTVSPARGSTEAFEKRFTEVVSPSTDGSTEAARTVVSLVRALRAGEIAPRPTSPKWCAQCGLDGACRRPRFAVTLNDTETGAPLSQRGGEDT